VAGAGEPLTVAIGLGGSSRARETASQVLFVSPAGRVALRYGGLAAVDASGRRLASALGLAGHRLLLHVDDRRARYPVRIDPLIQQGAKLTASGETGSVNFGVAVALSSDGNTALIGGDSDNSGAGAAWVFTRSGGVWTQAAKLTGGGESGPGSFGSSVALSLDGSTAMIGAEADNSGAGAAWVFTRSGSSWIQQGSKLLGDCTGVSCGGPNGTGETGPGNFGSSVALSSEGTALIGASADNTFVGAAWVFTLSGTTWSQQSMLTPSNETGGTATFGDSVALSSNGQTALIGGDSDNGIFGAAWVFTRSATTWGQGPKLVGDCTGGSCSGPNGTGESGGGFFGSSVALSPDGTTALIGGDSDGSGAGAAWVFTGSGSSWGQQGAKLIGDCSGSCSGPNGTGETPNGFFGSSVALSSDDDTALIGGDGDSALAGAAWVFTRAGATWSQQGAKLTASDEVNAGRSGAVLTYAVMAGPLHGSLAAFDPASGRVTYTSQAGFSGQDTFTYLVSDQWGVSNTATATITVPPAPPNCQNASASTPPGGGTVTITLTCAVPGGIGLSYTIVSGPTHGTLGSVDQTNGQVAYTAQPGYTGSDALAFQATDSGGASNTATVTIGVPPATPRCANVVVSTRVGGGTVIVPLQCTAPSGVTLTYRIVTPPPHGKLAAINQSTGQVSSTSQRGHFGSEAFTYQATDSGGTSNTAIRTITIPTPARVNNTMSWNFDPFPTYTIVKELAVNGPVPAATKVELACETKHCPIKAHSDVAKGRRICTGRGKNRKCRTVRPRRRQVDLSKLVSGRHVGVGTVLTVTMSQPGAIGKQFIFKMRARKLPSITIVYLLPGTTTPCSSC
jgi:hypothetical protein